ncbi:unnamed protein product [Haemonchus placei]|uniref:Secreted protein n=1 Tax=Haemonchus placei TaxID=6290 RepID=A0A3P7WG09_HAEPC|nr:unnamed protein product [Haemonchus placei]
MVLCSTSSVLAFLIARTTALRPKMSLVTVKNVQPSEQFPFRNESLRKCFLPTGSTQRRPQGSTSLVSVPVAAYGLLSLFRCEQGRLIDGMRFVCCALGATILGRIFSRRP